MIKVSLSEKDFTKLVKGEVLTVSNNKLGDTIQIALKDIGFDYMKNTIIQAQVDQLFKEDSK